MDSSTEKERVILNGAKNLATYVKCGLDLPVLLILLLAAALRLASLDIKPPHFDEGVNGWFVDQITHTGFFHYDAENYHGPLHFYVLFVFQTLFGRHSWALRLPLAIVGTVTIWLLCRFDRFLDRRTCLFAGLAAAVSPGMIFYSRYAIHESWLVLFLVLTVWALAGLWIEGKQKYLWAAAMGLTGMVLTKETYLIHAGCLILAALLLHVLDRFSPAAPMQRALQQWTRRDLMAAVGTGVLLIVFFYSGGFLDFSSLLGLPPAQLAATPISEIVAANPFLHTFVAWAQTGTQGHGHEKPFLYWLIPTGGSAGLMARYEWIALVGVAGSARFLLPGSDRLARFIAIYGSGTLLAYSIVHYKTPWCIITIIWPFFFVFGHLAHELAVRVNNWLATSVVVLLCSASLVSAIRLNFRHYTHEDEPYVYVQTLNDLRKLTDPLSELVHLDPANYHLTGHIMLPSYHPLPWVLGDFPKIGYYENDRSPDTFDADFLIVDKSRIEEVEKALKQAYFTESFQLRGSMDVGRLYLNAESFRSVFQSREADFTP